MDQPALLAVGQVTIPSHVCSGAACVLQPRQRGAARRGREPAVPKRQGKIDCGI